MSTDGTRYPRIMIKYDYLSWIVFFSHSCGVRVSDLCEEQDTALDQYCGTG